MLNHFRKVYNYLSVIKPGEITKPLKRQNSFLILKLNNKRVKIRKF